MKTAHIVVRVEPDTKDRIEYLAWKHKMSITIMVTEAINDIWNLKDVDEADLEKFRRDVQSKRRKRK